MSNKLIGLHNHQVQFELDGNVYLIPREDVEEKFKLYWFKGDLYSEIAKAVRGDMEWLKKYKV